MKELFGIIFIVGMNVAIHELFHLMALTAQGVKGKIKFGTLSSYVEPLEPVPYQRLFFLSGALGNLFLALLAFGLNLDVLAWYSFIVFGLNILLFFPSSDSFHVFATNRLKNKVYLLLKSNENEYIINVEPINDLLVVSLWKVFGKMISFMVSLGLIMLLIFKVY